MSEKYQRTWKDEQERKGGCFTILGLFALPLLAMSALEILRMVGGVR